MSRSGYSDDCSNDWQWIMWRGRVESAIRGKRGQAFLRELIEALDAMPEKKLVYHDLQSEAGVCAIGSVGMKRGLDLSHIDPEDNQTLSQMFNIADSMVREIEYMNDEAYFGSTPDG